MGIRYSVLGAGAMGSAFGARLHLAGFEVELLNRSPEHGQAIRNNGLLAHIDGNSQRIDIPACTVERARSADVVIIFTKSYQIDAALEKLPASLNQSHFVTLQNGLGNAERVAKWIGLERTIEGVTMMPAEFIGPGEVASSDAAETWLYAADGQASELVDGIASDFNKAGIVSTVTAEVQRFIWQKACFNVAMNALCALTNGSPGLLLKFADGNALAHEIADETLGVAGQIGVTVDGDKVHQLIDYACANHTWHRPSMLQDLNHGRITEVDALNGYIGQVALQHGLTAPLNHMMARLIKLREVSESFWSGKPEA
jgi:2-dehydropantoate 2-reductase